MLLSVVLLPLMLLLSTGATPIVSEPVTSDHDVKVVDFAGLEKYLDQYRDRTVVVNFWATWCMPCVRELPHLESVTQKYPEDKVMVILVSLDFPNQLSSRLKPFLKQHNIQSRVVLLDDADANKWIDKVDPSWSGAIPVTVIRKGDRKQFYPRAFQSFEELDNAIQSFNQS